MEAQVQEIERRYREDFDKDWVRGKIPNSPAGRQLWKRSLRAPYWPAKI
ncbi:hypothetical protein [Mesomycoplasma hyopneumoniae]